MSRVHDDDHSTYYLDQLCTIGVCALLGGVAVLLWVGATYMAPPRGQPPMLALMLVPKFRLPVLLGGAGLLLLAGIRTASLFPGPKAAGHTHVPDHDHPHDHVHEPDLAAEPHVHCPGEACGHDHDHHHEEAGAADAGEHAHDDHGHEHGWAPWRYAVLLLPAVLFFLGLPAHSFSNIKPTAVPAMDESHGVTEKGELGLLEFKELDRAAYNPTRRAFYQGHIGHLRGQLSRGSTGDTVFTLVRFRMTCCAADAIPIRVVIVAPFGVANIPDLTWVEVKGQIQFRKLHDRNEFVPVLQVKKPAHIHEIDPEPDLYIQ